MEEPSEYELFDAALRIYMEFLLPEKGGISHYFPSAVIYDIGEVLRSHDTSLTESYQRYGLQVPQSKIPVRKNLFDFVQQYVLGKFVYLCLFMFINSSTNSFIYVLI